MKISVAPYQLNPKNPQLNSQTYQEIKTGALVKVDYGEAVGFADYHSQDVLGLSKFDLRQYFKQLIDEKLLSEQWEQTLFLCHKMAYGQKLKENVVKSHYLIQNIKSFSSLDLLRAETAGFSLFKVKMGQSLRSETNALIDIVKKASLSAKFRLDFNSSLKKEDFIIWLNKEKDFLLKKIDFIEDPFKFDSSMWQHIEEKYSVQLALDQAKNPLDLSIDKLPKVVVVKPAIQNSLKLALHLKGAATKIVVTHYMDHPLGQLGAIYSHFLVQEILPNQILPGGLSGFGLFLEQELPISHLINKSEIESSEFNKNNNWMFEKYLKELDWFPIN